MWQIDQRCPLNVNGNRVWGGGGRLEAGIRTDCVDEESLRGFCHSRKALKVGNTQTNKKRGHASFPLIASRGVCQRSDSRARAQACKPVKRGWFSVLPVPLALPLTIQAWYSVCVWAIKDNRRNQVLFNTTGKPMRPSAKKKKNQSCLLSAIQGLDSLTVILTPSDKRFCGACSLNQEIMKLLFSSSIRNARFSLHLGRPAPDRSRFMLKLAGGAPVSR